jgi:hypothetical protein
MPSQFYKSFSKWKSTVVINRLAGMKNEDFHQKTIIEYLWYLYRKFKYATEYNLYRLTKDQLDVLLKNIPDQINYIVNSSHDDGTWKYNYKKPYIPFFELEPYKGISNPYNLKQLQPADTYALKWLLADINTYYPPLEDNVDSVHE